MVFVNNFAYINLFMALSNQFLFVYAVSRRRLGRTGVSGTGRMCPLTFWCYGRLIGTKL